MRSDLPATDVALYLQALYFRMENNEFFVPVSLIVPGSQIPFVKNGDRDKATIDVIGQVKNAQGIIVGNSRETVKLALDQAQQVQRKNIQYSTGFTLAPGRYHLKFVVRENQTGAMGSFETDLQVPDLKKLPMKLSSIVLASQRVANTDKKNTSPLVRDGFEWIPNLPHVFRQDQHLYFLYEVYDPSRVKANGEAAPPATPKGMTRRESGAGASANEHRVSEWGREGVRDAAGGGEDGERGGAECGGVPVRCGAGTAYAGELRVPGECDRRCGREFYVS